MPSFLKLNILAALLMVSGQAFATSGGSSTTERLEVCNVGVKHVYNSNEARGGDDRILFNYEDLTAPVGHPSRYRSDSITAIKDNSSFKVGDVSPFLVRFTNLKFNFSTETLGTQYFVQLCYRGPQVDRPGQGNGNSPDRSQGNYELNMNVGLLDSLSGGRSYINQARLMSKIEVKCDLRSRGAFQGAPASNDNITEPESDFYWQSDVFEWSSNQFAMDMLINSVRAQVPRYCVLRLYFSESFRAERKQETGLRELDLNVSITKKEF